MMLRRLMMAGVGAPAALTAWDASRLSPLGALSESAYVLGAGGSGQYANCRSLSLITGLVYTSAWATRGTGTNWGVGLMDATVAAGNGAWVGAGQSAGIWQEGRVYQGGAVLHYVGSFSVASDVQIAVRAASRRYWMRVNDGAWIGGGNPATDTTPTGTLPGTGAIYIAGSIDSRSGTSGTIRLPTTSAGITGAVPAGFSSGVP